MKRTKVLVVDDSSVVRQLLTNMLQQEDNLEVVGTAGDPYQAVDKIKKLKPDVLTLDVEMPKMDGLEFLRRLMATFPLPVVMISSLTTQGSKETLKALELGAVDFVAKPDLIDDKAKEKFKREVIAKVKIAAGVKGKKLDRLQKSSTQTKSSAEKSSFSAGNKTQQEVVIGIGASTGGVKAVKEVISSLPAELPGIVIIQHMPKGFTEAFAGTLSHVSDLKIKEAEDGDKILPGQALIVPGDRHLEVKKKGKSYYVELNQGPKVNHQRPAVDVTFKSLAETAGKNTIAVLMTGMGDDGARGLKMIKEAGGYTLAQDEETSTIFGMPKAAIELGAAVDVVPLEKVADKVLYKLNHS